MRCGGKLLKKVRRLVSNRRRPHLQSCKSSIKSWWVLGSLNSYKTSRWILSVYLWQPFARGNCSHFIANLLAFPVKYAASTFNTNDHPKKHTRKYPDKYDIPSTYTCHICQKSFHYEGNYRKHLKTHQRTVPSAPPSANQRRQCMIYTTIHQCVQLTY